MRCNLFDWNKAHEINENIENEIYEHKMKTFLYTTWRQRFHECFLRDMRKGLVSI